MTMTQHKIVTQQGELTELSKNDLSALMMLTSGYALPGTTLVTDGFTFCKLQNSISVYLTGHKDREISIYDHSYESVSDSAAKQLFD